MDKLIRDIVKTKFGDAVVTNVNEGASIASLYYVQSTENYYIKIQEKRNHYKGLIDEKKAYEFLDGKVLIPEIIFYEIHDGYEVLCITEITGHNFEKLRSVKCDREVIELYARGLRKLHNLSIEHCTLINPLEDKIRSAKCSVENDLVDYENFEEEYKQYTPEVLYQKMICRKPLSDELVFTHGDYCFDNVMLSEGTVGYIDIGNGGIADRYQDIALAVRCILHDYGREYLDLFYESYGLEEVNKEKIEFYILLDEFS